ADDRLRCWVAGWVCILIHIGLKLWIPQSSVGRFVNVCMGIDALVLAAIFFIVSTMIVREGRRAGIHLGGVLALCTLPHLSLAIAHPRPSWWLTVLVIARQLIVVRLAMRSRVNRPAILKVVIPACTITLVWMIYGIRHGRRDVLRSRCRFLAERVGTITGAHDHVHGIDRICRSVSRRNPAREGSVAK